MLLHEICESSRFRLCGSGIGELVGIDLTGKTLCGVFGEAGQAALLEHFGDIRDRRLIGFIASAVATAGREFMFTKVIELPLGNERGEVRQILHAMVPAKRPER